MASISTPPIAADLMEPLRVAAGAGESVASARRRLALQGARAAVVVQKGRPWGVIDLDLAEAAIRHGLGDLACREVACPEPATVNPSATLGTLHRASLSIAPALLVARADGTVLGLVERDRVVRELWAVRETRGEKVSRRGRQVAGLLRAQLGEERFGHLELAGEIAMDAGMALYLVGGIVRDLLIGSRVADLDLVVEGDGLAFAGSLAEALGASVQRHQAFRTAVVTLPSGQRIDVASARAEVYAAPAALPTVSPGSMHADLARRDVTFNAMAIRIGGPLHGLLRDDLGGRSDLMEGRLKVHHRLSLVEDPTRALRIARFAARFGFKPDKETLAGLDLARRFGAFERLTGERLYREFCRIGSEPDPGDALDWFNRLDLLPALGPGLAWTRAARGILGRLCESMNRGAWSGMARTPELPLLALMVLSAGARPAQRAAVADRLRIAGDARDRLVGLGREMGRLRRSLAAARRPSRVARACESAPVEALMLVWASADRAARQQVESYLSEYRHIRPGLSGAELKRLGMKEGPGLGRVLEALREAALDGRIKGKEEESRLARDLVEAAGRMSRRRGD